MVVRTLIIIDTMLNMYKRERKREREREREREIERGREKKRSLSRLEAELGGMMHW